MKEARQIQPFRLESTSSSLRSNAKKNLGVLNLVVDLVVFFAIICRLLPSTTTDGGHEHIQRGYSFSIAQQKAVEEEEEDNDEDGEEVEVALEKSTEETEEEEMVVEKKNELLLISAQQYAVEEEEKADEEGEEVLEKSKEEEEVVEKKKEDLEEVEVEENENNGPHRSGTKREHHHHQYHRLCRRHSQLTMNQKQPTVGNERKNSGSSLTSRQESFLAPEERIFAYNQVNRYQYAPLHRPDASAPPIPEFYDTQYTSNPRTIRRVDAFTSPASLPQPTVKSKRDPLPQPPPRRRKEREERRVSTQSKKAKKGESGRFPFQSGVPPATRQIQPPLPEIAPSVQPSQSSVAQSSSPVPPPPAHPQSFLTELFKPNNNKKKVNSKAAQPHPLADPPTSSVLQKFVKKSSQIKKFLSGAGLPPPLPPQPPAPPPLPEPPPPKKTSEKPPVPPVGSSNLHKNTRPSSPMPQNLTFPAPKATKPCGMKRATNHGTPVPTITNNSNTLLRKRKQTTDSHFKKEIYVEIGDNLH
ncbi:hypothetical protein C5167_026847 [Papaver somniferum]|uniref:formin-like protein 5 n=1 Tax=Papaver somniferum TaxID=3469 RepID=UPI000E700645|nr:formin-like protein 5 [Papaver somniferum]RZC92213.1 hypothetical protein C5167_026847 [Papaver somniferum]